MGRLRDKMVEEAGEESIDISPLIDCVFILLIFFIVTTTFVSDIGISAEKSSPSQAQQTLLGDDALSFLLTADGRVLQKGAVVSLQGIRPLVKQFVIDNPGTPITIDANDRTPHEMLVRVMDMISSSGGTPMLGKTSAN